MFYKFLISLMLCAVISLFFINKPNGQKLLTTAVIQQDITHVFEQVKTGMSNTQRDIFTGNNDAPKSVTLYRWQDSQGQWHFTDKENNNPNSTENTHAMTITANTPLTSQNKPPPTTINTDNTASQAPTNAPLSALPLMNAFNTLEDAQHIQTLMDQHGEQLENSINNIGK